MLSVPWFVGWALKPYIQISGGSGSGTAPPSSDDSGSVTARSQISKVSSSSSSNAAKPVSSAPAPKPASTTASATSKPYPVVTQPIAAKPNGNQVQPQPVQQVSVAKTTATRTAAAPAPNTNPIVPKQAQPTQAASPPAPQQQQQQQNEGPVKQVSSSSITLKMSAEWAQKQLEKFKFSFDEADSDKSGSLSIDEVCNILTKNGFKGSKDEAKQLFSLLDVNKDNKLSRDEFTTALNKLPRCTIKEFVLRKAFKQLDKDGSGTLTKAEIEAATQKDAGLDIAAEKINDLLKFLEKESKDDVIDYEEFLRVFGVHATATVMHQVFTTLDKDNSGFLTREEIMKALDAESELKLRAAKISDLILAWHKDADKKINYNEFVQVWIKYK
ncbi:uncharacterized protein [Littorina saxatilis]|uniref:EF-hand domain-containing protein n=1 Tax=Littorina saxatilis TaxID=31220 RepID=A0AAN9GMH5_9CAEN